MVIMNIIEMFMLIMLIMKMSMMMNVAFCYVVLYLACIPYSFIILFTMPHSIF